MYYPKTRLRKSENVNIFLEEDGSVRIVPAEAGKEKTATLHVDKKTTLKSFNLFIKTNYMDGCNIINIESKRKTKPRTKNS
ncbi:MAG: hypothetical protein DRO36_04765 [Candidatus Hecatellales archaeon]|nr:MAG: hypothetical protein DRO36_04765 [Candidatus Hecatellales archaeon]